MNISEEVLKKYELPTLESFIEALGMDEREYCRLVLHKTDHVPLKIFEAYTVFMVENNVNVGSMKKFFEDVKEEYGDVLEARKFAREEINRIESEMATE